MTCHLCKKDLDESFFSLGCRTAIPSRRVCRKCNNERIKKYQAAHRDKIREYNRRYERENVAQRNAKSAVKHAVKDGSLKVRPCAVCGSTIDVEAHHFSYEPRHWLSVYWLCRVHHGGVRAGEVSLGGLPVTIGTVKRSAAMIRDILQHLDDPLIPRLPTVGNSIAARLGRALTPAAPTAQDVSK